MKKIFTSTSGLFNPRFFAAFFLCCAGILLALFGTAAPQPASRMNAAALKPIVRTAAIYGISPALRDLPAAQPVFRREFEKELRRVRPNYPFPCGFVDPAIQAAA